MTITVDDTKHAVPEGITVIQAMWHLGRSLIHGVGCLGGACGACAIMTRLPGQMLPKTALACQTMVSDGMNITFLSPDSSKKAIARLPDEMPTRDHLFQHYPETRRCVACQACSSACPQDIDVMVGVREMLIGDLAAVAERFTSCVMCGLCAAVCESRVRPHRVGLYARRLHGAFYPKAPAQLIDRIEEISAGRYQPEWGDAMQMTGNG
ncbi:MAG: 4Fe-4S dicluster domain-containing protein [Nitrospiria bacterium]